MKKEQMQKTNDKSGMPPHMQREVNCRAVENIGNRAALARTMYVLSVAQLVLTSILAIACIPFSLYNLYLLPANEYLTRGIKCGMAVAFVGMIVVVVMAVVHATGEMKVMRYKYHKYAR